MARKTIDVNQMTFGVEIECYLPFIAANEIGVGRYSRPIQGNGLPIGWLTKTDSSLDRPPMGMVGVEIVSPVLRGAEGIRQLIEVLAFVRSKGGAVNHTCGLHVHIGIAPDTRSVDTEDVCRVIRLAARHEKALYAVTGTHSREAGSFCNSIKEDENGYVAKYRDGKPVDLYTIYRPRYRTVNTMNIELGERPTVEFRVFAGTLNATKAVMHVRLALGIVHRALTLNGKARWDRVARPSSKRRGAGAEATYHMMSELGWVGSYRKDRTGLAGEGIGPDLAAMVAEANRLASKYDNRSADESSPTADH